MILIKRRELLKVGAAALATAGLYGCNSGTRANGHVVVVGGGFGGATAAKYLRMWSQGTVDVTLVEPNPHFTSCPMSNLVIGGSKKLEDLSLSYDNLRNKWGVRVIQGTVTRINANNYVANLATGDTLEYQRLILATGIDFDYSLIPGLNNYEAQQQVLHAWKAGPQTVALRQQLEAMPDGGVFLMTIPKAPYRCPPGPYERASLVADYFKRAKPRSKVVILDANDDIVSKRALFLRAWADLYPNIIEYRPNNEVKDVDVADKRVLLDFESVKGDVINVIPPQGPARMAALVGGKKINGNWIDVQWPSMESHFSPGIHVIGDSIYAGPGIPKSAHMANQQGKLVAAAVVNLLAGELPNDQPMLMNTCYSYVDTKNAMHVSSVHSFDPATRSMQPVKGAGGLSRTHSEAEGQIAQGWARNIWADTLA